MATETGNGERVCPRCHQPQDQRQRWCNHPIHQDRPEFYKTHPPLPPVDDRNIRVGRHIMPDDPKRRRAGELLGEGWSKAAVARLVGVSKTTVFRWASQPEFQQWVQAVRQQRKLEDPAAMHAQMYRVTAVLEEELSSPSHQIRVRAARRLAEIYGDRYRALLQSEDRKRTHRASKERLAQLMAAVKGEE